MCPVCASFNYDVLGRRTQKTVSTQSSALSTAFLYDGNDIAAEIGGGAVGVNYVRSLNIDESFIRQSGSGNEFYHADALGSSVALSNAQGASATTYSYEPFGKTTATSTSTNPFQYTGREADGTGLLYYRARYYQPRLQRFISEDSIGFLSGSSNFYAYVHNNPLVFSDPLGLWEIQVQFQWIMTNYQWDLRKSLQQRQVVICRETILFPNVGGGVQVQLDPPPTTPNQFTVTAGVGHHMSLGTTFIPNPDFNGSNQSYVTKGLNISIGADVIPFPGSISVPQSCSCD